MVKADGAPNRAGGYHYCSKPEISRNREAAIFCELYGDILRDTVTSNTSLIDQFSFSTEPSHSQQYGVPLARLFCFRNT